MKVKMMILMTLCLSVGFVLTSASTATNGGKVAFAARQTGNLQICKVISGSGLTNRIFRFRVSGQIVEVVAGQCSSPIVVPAGANVIEELSDGRTTTGGTFSGGFRLTGVSVLGTTPATVITGSNLALRTVNVNISANTTQARIQFTNSAIIYPKPPPFFSGDTFAGLDVSLEPTSNLKLTFNNITTAGNTTVTALSREQAPPLPAQFSSADVLIYEITTSAAFSDGVAVSFKVPNVEDAATCSLYRILQYTDDIFGETGDTASVYKSENQTCTVSQTVSSLSLFVIARIEDSDNDGISDTADNCPNISNPNQADNDGDGIGDVCDSDDDGDGVSDAADNCPLTFNPDQADFDGDGIGDVCDLHTGPPRDKEQCKNGNFTRFDVPRRFKNQGDCIQFVNTGK